MNILKLNGALLTFQGIILYVTFDIAELQANLFKLMFYSYYNCISSSFFLAGFKEISLHVCHLRCTETKSVNIEFNSIFDLVEFQITI